MKKIILIVISLSFYAQLHSYQNNTEDKKPYWVNGSLPVSSNELYAVGMVNIGTNKILSQRRSENDARQELGKLMNTKVMSVMESFYKESSDILESEGISSTEMTTYITKSVSEAVLIGVEIVDKYIDEDENIYYTLAKMKKEDVVPEIIKVVDAVLSDDSNRTISSTAVTKDETKIKLNQMLDDELEKWDLTK
jgi:hypothetical protein